MKRLVLESSRRCCLSLLIWAVPRPINISAKNRPATKISMVRQLNLCIKSALQHPSAAIDGRGFALNAKRGSPPPCPRLTISRVSTSKKWIMLLINDPRSGAIRTGGATQRSRKLSAGKTILIQTNTTLCRAIVVSIAAAVGVNIQLAGLRSARDRPRLSVAPRYCSGPQGYRMPSAEPRAGVGTSTRRGRRDQGGYDPCRIMIGMQPPPAPSPRVPP